MNLLLVDGNEKEASDQYTKMGMDNQYQVYEKILKKYSNSKISVTTIHPAIDDNYLPIGISLDDFEAVAWTGSLLNIYNVTKSITNQIELAKELFKRKNKIFGSCWGLQVLITAAGGKVRKNPNGLEAVLAKNITLNQDGEIHPMYKNKKKSFNALCWHYDEAENLPKETKVLASNKYSQYQSISFEINRSSVWAVQYHPEFNSKWMAGLMEMRKDILLDEKVYENLSEFENEKIILQHPNNLGQKELQIYDDIIDQDTHSLELSNWLNFNRNY